MHQPRPRPGIHHTSKSCLAPSPEEYYLPKLPPSLSPALRITVTKISSDDNLLPPQSIGSSPSRTDGLTDSQDYFSSPSYLASLNQIAKPVTQKLKQISQAGSVNPSPSQWRSSFESTGESSVESHTSSRFLTPPSRPKTPETEKLPYKAMRKSSESLIMVKISRKDSTVWKKGRRRQNKGRKCFLKHRQISQKPWNKPTYQVPRCQVALTALKELRWLCQKLVGYIDLVVINDLARRYKGMGSAGTQSENIRRRVTRRWSSVEYESHQVPSRELNVSSETAYPRPPNSSHGRSQHSQNPSPAPDMSWCIAQELRGKLISYEAPMTGPKIPSTITLQRASEGDEQLGIEPPFSVFLSDHSPAEGSSMPKIQIAQAQNDRRYSECVIIAHETDSTTETTKSGFKDLSISHPSAKYLSHNSMEISASHNSRVVTFTAKGFLPTTSTVADSAATPVEAHRFSNKLTNIHDEFQFPPKPKKGHVENKNLLRKSAEEIIWTAGASDTFEDSGYFRLELSSTDRSPPTAKPPSLSRINIAVKSQVNQESDTRESINALTLMNKWSWGVSSAALSGPSDIQTLEKPQLQDFMITPPPYQSRRRPSVRRVRSDSNESHRQRAFLQLKPRASDSLIESGPLINNVVSFPPLPRKLTRDWISPLPDIRANSIHGRHLACGRGSDGPRRKSLYLEGIDATVVTTMSFTSQPSPKVCAGRCSYCGYEIDSIALFNLEHSDSPRNCQSTLSLKAPPLSPKLVLDPQYGMKWNKSVVIVHPNAPARTGSSSAIGSSLGASSHVRRRSVYASVFGDKFKTCSTWGNANSDFAYLRPPSSSSFAGSGTPSGPGQTDGDNNNWQKLWTCY